METLSPFVEPRPAADGALPARFRLVLSNGEALSDVTLLRVGGGRPESAADLGALLDAVLATDARRSFLTFAAGPEVEVVPLAWVERLEAAGGPTWLRADGQGAGRDGLLSGFVLQENQLCAEACFRPWLMEGSAGRA